MSSSKPSRSLKRRQPTPPPADAEWYEPLEVAALLRIPYEGVLEMIHGTRSNGPQLAAQKFGRYYRVHRSEIARLREQAGSVTG